MNGPVETYDFLGMTAVFASPVMKAVLERVQRAALTPAAVLVQGECGVGKEVVARALHHYSMRSGKPWVDINCAALPEHLVESELFGYEKGAFSGADGRKPGIFELAEGGTLFLDEVGELDSRMQVKLLRVLDCGEFFRLGGLKKTKVNVRIVAATNTDLGRAVEEGRFRKDLYHRLAQLRVEVPPLRQRPEDILPLAETFREKYGIVAEFSGPVKDIFLRYEWPGNVRELRNTVVAAAAEGDEEELQTDHLPPEILEAVVEQVRQTRDLLNLAGLSDLASVEPFPGEGLLACTERRLILTVLKQAGGRQEAAARILGISSRTLRRKLREWEALACPPPAGEESPEVVLEGAR
ncbi:MAG: sigma-54-dependent Fis family transcriptional regulator [Bryobacteraceae bacterium]|nr:sigma-54-dependent Fis family transcriptional regulator [Bryobacteraceae bacterium]